jgi:hypothetical protein
MLKLLSLLFVFFSFGICVFSQSPPPPPEPRTYPTIRRDEFPRRPLALRNVWVSEYEPNTEEKRLLQPSIEDEQKFAEFLRLPGTGIIRLYSPGPRRVISIAELEEGRRPGFGRFASMYSFTKLRHGSALHGWVDPRLGWGELRIVDGRFYSGFSGESLGVMVALGDVPLAEVSENSDGVTGLTNITRPLITLKQRP